MNDFRKKIFLNSQYCTYYIEKDCTIIAGIMRSFGYKYAVKLPKEKLAQINAIYRKFTTLVNCFVGVEILLYVYLFMFPCFLNLIKMNYFVMALSLSIIPLVMLYITYIAVNYLYENYLNRYVGTFQKVKFQPDIYSIEPEAYETYRKTPKKSVYVMALIMAIFLYFVLMPIGIDTMVAKGKYKNALNASNIYSKLIPISSDVYAQRAYSKFKLGKYEDAVADYKLAEAYSLSDVFNLDILGVKTYYMPFNAVIDEFDTEIAKCEEKPEKQFLMAEKANYLMKNKKYNQALAIYNELISSYLKHEDIAFAPDEVYFHRAEARTQLGDIRGAKTDNAIAKKMCPDCKYSFDTKLIRMP